jgi:hypothetical protein
MNESIDSTINSQSPFLRSVQLDTNAWLLYAFVQCSAVIRMEMLNKCKFFPGHNHYSNCVTDVIQTWLDGGQGP